MRFFFFFIEESRRRGGLKEGGEQVKKGREGEMPQMLSGFLQPWSSRNRPDQIVPHSLLYSYGIVRSTSSSTSLARCLSDVARKRRTGFEKFDTK